MGVPGLWEILAPAGTSTSLHSLALDAFEQNTAGKRAFRLGIDASIWFNHACIVKEGENPELRTLFFRVKELTKLPVLPLFVFDGRSRPKVKRGSRMGKSGAHSLSMGFKKMLDAFGMHWREAEGEAEAELAFLNRAGVIDAVMTDDVDCFLFGALTVIKNQSSKLSGNRSNPAHNMDGKPSKSHLMVYNSSRISNSPEVGMSQGGLILFALLTGGDYDKGVDKIGKVTAEALARSYLGTELDGALQNRETVSLHNFLPAWRDRINLELRSNASRLLKRASPGLSLPSTFPNLSVLDKYANPVRRTGGIQGVWTDKELSLPQVAAFCEAHFEWASRDVVIQRFRNFMWEGCVTRLLRRAALAQDTDEVERMLVLGIPDTRVQQCLRPDESVAVGTPVSMVSRHLNSNNAQDRVARLSAAFANPGPSRLASNPSLVDNSSPSFILKIHSERRHVSTDRSLEYRIEVDPSTFVTLANSGMKGTRKANDSARSLMQDADESDEEGGSPSAPGSRKAHPEPMSPFRMWCPGPMLWRVNPSLVRDFEEKRTGKRQDPSRRTSGSPQGSASQDERAKKKKRKSSHPDSESDEEGTTTRKRVYADRDPVRRRLFMEGPSATTHDFSVHGLVSKVQRSQKRTAAPATRSFGNPDSSMTERNQLLRPLEMAHKAAKLPRSESMPLPSFQTQASSSRIALGGKASQSLSQSRNQSRMSDIDDVASLFLHHIPDPCNPDLIEREDLRKQAPEITFEWTELPPLYPPEESDDDSIIFGDKALDAFHQRHFLKEAHASSGSKSPNTKKPQAPVGHTSKHFHQSGSLNRHRQLPRRAPPPSTQASDQTDLADTSSTVIDLSSDEDEDIISSSTTLLSDSSRTLFNSSPTIFARSSSIFRSAGENEVPFIDLC